MLTIHHLGKSQSERIVWLCEELGIPYEMKRYERLASNNLAPPELASLTPMGTAPAMTDGDVTMTESAAIAEYIIAKHGQGRLALRPDHPDYAQYLFWFHFANGSLQPAMGRMMTFRRLDTPPDNAYMGAVRTRLKRALNAVEARLSQAPWLAGSEFTAADVMIGFTLTTMRLFYPVDLAPYPRIREYLQRIGARPAYQRAMKKGDPDLEPLLG